MLNKKAQATSWSLKEIGTLVLRILAVLVLILFIVGIVSIFTDPRALGNAYQDFERIIGEIQDIENGESINVPILSVDHSMIIRSIEVANSLNLGCGRDGNYCGCLQNEDEEILTCKPINVNGEISRTDVDFIPRAGVTVSRENDRIRVS